MPVGEALVAVVFGEIGVGGVVVLFGIFFMITVGFGVFGYDFLDQSCSLVVDGFSVGLVVFEGEVLAAVYEGHLSTGHG